jgi:hypothetical protein
LEPEPLTVTPLRRAKTRFSEKNITRILLIAIRPSEKDYRRYLMLEKYDNASDKLAVKDDIKRYVTNFNTLRNNYEEVFSKTRIMANPAEYILDENQHRHLANGTNNSDWMYVYELAMNSKINDWAAGN